MLLVAYATVDWYEAERYCSAIEWTWFTANRLTPESEKAAQEAVHELHSELE
jgi:hypothetical protein